MCQVYNHARRYSACYYALPANRLARTFPHIACPESRRVSAAQAARLAPVGAGLRAARLQSRVFSRRRSRACCALRARSRTNHSRLVTGHEFTCATTTDIARALAAAPQIPTLIPRAKINFLPNLLYDFPSKQLCQELSRAQFTKRGQHENI